MISTGKALLSLTSACSAIGSHVFDRNETHIHNPEWPAHAKFHNAQTMSTGAALGAAGLYTLWGTPQPVDPRPTPGQRRRHYPVPGHQLSTTLYPGTALFDHARSESEEQPPRFRGPQTIIAGTTLALNLLAYALQARRLARLAPAIVREQADQV